MSVTPETKVPFGRFPHKGAKMKNLSDTYLKWMVNKLPNTDLHEFATVAKKILESRKSDESILNLKEQADQWLKDAGFDENGKPS